MRLGADEGTYTCLTTLTVTEFNLTQRQMLRYCTTKSKIEGHPALIDVIINFWA